MKKLSLSKKIFCIAAAMLFACAAVFAILIGMPKEKVGAESNYFPDDNSNAYLYQFKDDNCFEFMRGSVGLGKYSPTVGDFMYNIDWWVYLPVFNAGTSESKSASRFYLALSISVRSVVSNSRGDAIIADSGLLASGMIIIPVKVSTTTPNIEIFMHEGRISSGYDYQTLKICFQPGSFYNGNMFLAGLSPSQNYCRTQEVPYMRNNATLKYPGVAYNNDKWGTLTFCKVIYTTQATTPKPYDSLYLRVLSLNGNTAIYKENITSDPYPTKYIYTRMYALGFGLVSHAIYTESEYINYGNDKFEQGKNEGYSSGYSFGYDAGVNAGKNYSFLSLMSSVVDAPVKAFTGLLNFEVLGFNMAGFVISLLSVALLLKIIMVFKNGGG